MYNNFRYTANRVGYDARVCRSPLLPWPHWAYLLRGWGWVQHYRFCENPNVDDGAISKPVQPIPDVAKIVSTFVPFQYRNPGKPKANFVSVVASASNAAPCLHQVYTTFGISAMGECSVIRQPGEMNTRGFVFVLLPEKTPVSTPINNPAVIVGSDNVWISFPAKGCCQKKPTASSFCFQFRINPAPFIKRMISLVQVSPINWASSLNPGSFQPCRRNGKISSPACTTSAFLKIAAAVFWKK